MKNNEKQEETKIFWTENTEYIHPSQDFKITENDNNTTQIIAYTTQTFPSITTTTKNGQTTTTAQETNVVITSEGQTIPITPTTKKIQQFNIKTIPSHYGGHRWEKKSIKEHIAKKNITPNFKQAHTQINEQLQNYFEFDDERIYDVVTCWTIGTYFHQLFQFFPILYLNAAKGSGKTKLLNFLYQISFNPVFCQDPTDSTIFRLAHANKCTILIDEIEHTQSKEKRGIRSLLLGSPNKGITIPRSEQKNQKTAFEVNLYDLYGPRAIANITGIDDVLEDRCITIILKRALNKNILNREIQGDLPIWQKIRNTLYQLMLADHASYQGAHALYRVNADFKIPDNWDDSVVCVENAVSVKKEDTPLFSPIFMKNKAIQELLYTQTTLYTQKMLEKLGTTFSTQTTPFTQTTPNKPTQPTPTKNVSDMGKELVVGRNLSVWRPILCVSALVGSQTLLNVLSYAVEAIEIKKVDSDVDNIHITLTQVLIKVADSSRFYRGRVILDYLRNYEGFDWVTAQWLGRALKGLGIRNKRRASGGFEYFLDVGVLQQLARRFALDYGLLRDEADVERAERGGEDFSPALRVPVEGVDES